MKKLILCILAALLVSVCPDAQPQATTAVKPRGRALLVGVNEYQVKGINPTPGAIEDALAIGKLIQDKGWFAPQEVKTLIGERATAANIEREFHECLIRGTSPGDRVFFLYSGHGTQTPDDDGDERRSDPTDDQDEAIAPYDVNVSERRLVNIIRDDQFNDWLGRLGERSIVMVFDSCNSGVQAPEGKDVIVALLTRDKLARPKDDPPLTWKQVFALLGSPELEQTVRTRGQGERLKGKTLADTDWQAVALSSEAVKSCERLSRP